MRDGGTGKRYDGMLGHKRLVLHLDHHILPEPLCQSLLMADVFHASYTKITPDSLCWNILITSGSFEDPTSAHFYDSIMSCSSTVSVNDSSFFISLYFIQTAFDPRCGEALV